MRAQRAILSLAFAVSFAVSAATNPGLPASSAPSGAVVVEYDWTFFYRGGHYGVQQFGPVGIRPRFTHVILGNRAYPVPVTVPMALAIAACLVFAPIGFFVFRHKDKVHDA
jgi:hypothetical protein